MISDVIDLLIADDNEDICNILISVFKYDPKFNICGVFHNGNDALENIYKLKPDLVLLDLIMPELDGIDILRRLRSAPPEKYPKIIMTSAIGQESITTEAMSLGACYYLVKPFNINYLKEKVIKILSNDVKKVNDDTKRDVNAIIRETLMSLNAPTHMVGYNYITQSLEKMLKEEHIGGSCNSIYLSIADANNTTHQCVESAIRNTIAQIHKINNENYKRLFSDCISNNKKPTNLTFLTRIAENIKIIM